jgi:hypothetical protein
MTNSDCIVLGHALALTTSDWIALGSTLATLTGVIVSVFVLWKQLGKLSDQLFMQQFADYTKRYQDIILHFPEDINKHDFDFVGRSDYHQTMRYIRAYFDLCFEEWYLNERHLIDKETWVVWGGGMKTALSKTAFRQAWEIIKNDTSYGKKFENYIASLL